MLEFRYKNMDISLSFSFFALFAVLFYTNDPLGIISALAACTVHEIGHILAMTVYGCTPKKIIFYGGGIKIVPNFRIISVERELCIDLAGSVTNLVIGIAFIKLGRLHDFSAASVSLGIFNLLPFKVFDGGHILNLLFENTENDRIKKIYSIVVKFLCIVILAMGVYCMFQIKMSISLCVTICYIIISEVFS